MAKRLRSRRVLVSSTATLCALALIMALWPGLSQAAAPTETKVYKATATLDANLKPNPVEVACPTGSKAVGGGATGGSFYANHGPAMAGGAVEPISGNVDNPTAWWAEDPRGRDGTNAGLQVYVVCAVVDPVVRVVTVSTTPSTNPSSGQAEAPCPTNFRVTGGGARGRSGTIDSSPTFDEGGASPQANLKGWRGKDTTARTEQFGITVWAVCAEIETVVVRNTTPSNSSIPRRATCPTVAAGLAPYIATGGGAVGTPGAQSAPGLRTSASGVFTPYPADPATEGTNPTAWYGQDRANEPDIPGSVPGLKAYAVCIRGSVPPPTTTTTTQPTTTTTRPTTTTTQPTTTTTQPTTTTTQPTTTTTQPTTTTTQPTTTTTQPTTTQPTTTTTQPTTTTTQPTTTTTRPTTTTTQPTTTTTQPTTTTTQPPDNTNPCANPTIVGTDRANVIFGTPGNDIIDGKAGNDVIFGKGGDDTICGGAGNDKLFGDAGDDRLFGQDGNDIINGGTGKDFADGGSGRDHCRNSESSVSCESGARADVHSIGQRIREAFGSMFNR